MSDSLPEGRSRSVTRAPSMRTFVRPYQRVVCILAFAACGFPRPADVEPPDAPVGDGGDGGRTACARIGFPSLPWPAAGQSISAAAADLNNDGKPDIVA